MSQGRLLLPGLELVSFISSLPSPSLCSFEADHPSVISPQSYVFGALSHSPAYILSSLTLRRIQKVIDELEGVDPLTYGKGDEYWDGE